MINKTIIFSTFIIALSVSALLWHLAHQNSQIQMLLSAEQQHVSSLESLEQALRDLKTKQASKPNTIPTKAVQSAQSVTDDSSQYWRDNVDANIAWLADQIQDLSELTIDFKTLKIALEEVSQYTENTNLQQVDVSSPTKQPELSGEQKLAHRQAKIDELEYRLTDMTQADDAWSNATETAIDEALSTKPALMVANSYTQQCGGNVCKVSANVPGGLSALERDSFYWSLSMLSDELPAFTTQSTLLADGSREVVYYFSRMGHALSANVQP